MSNKIFSFFILLIINHISYSQNSLNVTINGLVSGDSANVKLTKGTNVLLVKKAKNPIDNSVQISFNNLETGEDWVIGIDAPGYSYPTSSVISIPSVTQISIDISKYSSDIFVYEWQDDSSFVGHATQTYINEPIELIVLNDTVPVPIDFSSIKLREEYGIVLSNENKEWSDEDAYRLYSNFERFDDVISRKTAEREVTNFQTGENLNSIWILTDEVLNNDINIQTIDNIKYITLSSYSLTYAEPLTVRLDGLRGKFFSKRLYKALLRYLSDSGNNNEVLDRIAQDRFGFSWMISNQETADLMNEPADHFQEFFPEEKLEILSMFEELPEGLHRLECNNYLVRRVNGQNNPTFTTAPAIAWTNGVMEFMEIAFSNVTSSYLRRLILHERAHYLWQCYIDQETKDAWIEVGGWYEDPTSPSGWSTWNTTEFVSSYAHEKNPNEDFAESISFYVENVDALKTRSMSKYEFIRDRIMSGTRYIAKIRDDLTFTVYNLFPDYFYPGKVIGTKVEVVGDPEEDKTLKFTIKLKSDSVELDGATGAQVRFHSSIGTLFDMWLYPVNGSIDSILTGEKPISKLAKSGYWRVVSINVWDNVGNTRLENTSTVGVKAFINNPLEDIDPAQYISYSLDTITDFFHEAGNELWIDNPSGPSVEYRALKVQQSWYDKSPMGRSLARLNFRNTAVYSKDGAQNSPCGSVYPCLDSILNGYNSIKNYTIYFAIPEYFPSDYYSITYLMTEDMAGNMSHSYLSVDTASFNDDPAKGIYKDLRDSIYIETTYPDTLAPIAKIDVGELTINAEPVNPISPDGETKVDISIIVKDTSNYFGHEASLTKINYILRDPKGVDHTFSYFPDGGNGFVTLTPDSAAYEWKSYIMNARLPKGSTPGLWGLSEVLLWDKAGNQRRYSFVEYVRFDVSASDIELTSPLYAEITDKVVNASNVDSISAFITCSPCADLKYNYTIYSQMGGVVKTGEKIMGSDSVYVTDLDVSGIPDGIITLTVQLKDTLDQLVATTSTDYTKDVILPSAYYLQTNLQDLGSSNLDSLVVDIITVEVNGEYTLTIIGDSILGENSIIPIEEDNPNFSGGIDIGTSTGLKGKKIIRGKVTSEALQISDIDLSNFGDGYITLDLIITDSALNVGIEIFRDSIYKNLPDAPVSYDIDTLSIEEDSTLIFTLRGTDADGDSLSYTITRQPSQGIIDLSDSIASYTPNTDYYGTDSLSYIVSDGYLTSDTSKISISIISVYDPPLISLSSNNLELIEESGFSELVAEAGGVDAGQEDISIRFYFSGSSISDDYSVSSDSIFIEKGSTTGKIDINIIDDIIFEEDETILIGIDSIVNAIEDSIQQIIITILSSDAPLGNERQNEILKIYPNPADQYIIIEQNDYDVISDIKIIDIAGKYMNFNYIKEDNKIIIDVSKFSRGSFILKIFKNDEFQNVKFNLE